MSRRTIIHSVCVLGAGDDADWVLFDDGLVAAVGTGDDWRPLEAAEVLDASAVAGPHAVLTPGFIDLHVHGGHGHGHEDGAAAILAARDFHRSHGTTRAVLSFATASMDALRESAALTASLTGRAGILGSHLEGPFLTPARKGAHDEALLRTPDLGVLEDLLQAGEGTVRQVTVAPELPGGLAAVERVVAAGAVCAIGHTDADRDTAARAFDAGATLLTHAFNAMPALLHRAPGPIGAALANPSVTLELIVDGTHVHPDLVRMLIAAAPERVALITDAMSAAGMPDGAYRLSSLDVMVRDGVARLRDGDGEGAIAGSTLTQDEALRRTVQAGVPLEAAVDALTRVPAAVLRRHDQGRLSSGSVADAVLLDSELRVRAVWADGEAIPRD